MKTESNYKLHITALSALFVLGDVFLDIPIGNANDKTFLCFLFSIAVTIVFFLISNYIARLFFSLNRDSIAFKLSASAVCLLILSASVISFSRFTNFASRIILPHVNKTAITLVLILCLLFTLIAKKEVILKYSLLAFVITAFIIIFFFIVSLRQLTPQNIFIFSLPSLPELFDGSFQYILRISLTACILPFFARAVLEKDYKGRMTVGITAGCVLAAVVLLNSIILFGAELAGKLSYPYSSAISTISVGYLFSRMDGFSYFLGFCCAIIRITVCFKTVKSIFSKT